MKKVITIILMFGLLMSCGNNSGGPEENAEKFLKAISAADFEEAKTYCTEETKKLVAVIESLAGEMKKGDVEIKIEGLTCEENEDKATCTYCCNDQGENETLNMKKVDGEWLVSISKDDVEK